MNLVKPLADWIMQRRADRLLRILRPFLTGQGTVVDLGSGTGHNGQAIRAATSLSVLEFDVADIHWIGPPPTMFVENQVPLDDNSAAVVLILHVLHYCDQPTALLSEAARISRDRVIVMQTTCENSLSAGLLRWQEFFFGRFGYFLARTTGLVSSEVCPLFPKRFFNRPSLEAYFSEVGLRIAAHQQHSYSPWPLKRNVYHLRKA
jgi:hypothetical protein